MLINPLGLIVVLVLVAPYLYGWLRIEVFGFVYDLDENLAKAWLMPKYRHYLLYIKVKFWWFMLNTRQSSLTEDEKMYAEMVREDLANSSDMPKYVLEGDLLSGKPKKIKSLVNFITERIKKARLPKRV